MSSAVLELKARPAGAARWSKAATAALIGLLVSAGIVSLAASLIPFGLVQAKARNLSASGQIPFFTQEFFRDMQLRLRAIGAAQFIAALLAFTFRRRICQLVEGTLGDFRILARDLKCAVWSLPKVELAVLFALFIFATFLRIPLLSQPIRYDEAFTFLKFASHPFYAALSFYSGPGNHLLNTLCVRLMYLVFGSHPWAFRLPVLLEGICLVPVTYLAARSLYRSSAGLVAGGLVASSSVLIEYSTYARGYIFVCLAFMALIPIGDYALRKQNVAAWLLFAIVVSLGFYAIPIMLYPFGGTVLWLLLSARRLGKEEFRKATIAVSAMAILTLCLTAEVYSPVLAVSGPKSLVANKWVVPIPTRIFIQTLPASLESTRREWNRSIPSWLSWALAVGFAVSLLDRARKPSKGVSLALALVFWVGLVLCAQRLVPFERVWLFALPLYFIISSAGLETGLALFTKRIGFRGAMPLIAVVIAAYLGLHEYPSRSAYLANDCRGIDGIAAYLKTELKAGDSVVAALPSDMPLYYYFEKEGLPLSFINAPPAQRLLVVVNGAAGDTQESLLGLKQAAGDARQARLLARYDSASLYEVPVHPLNNASTE